MNKPKCNKYNLSRVFKRNKWIILFFVVAFLVRIIVAAPLIHDWDGFVFSESAKNMLQGITPYETVEKNDPTIYPNSDRPMTEQWYGYPPLPLIMFTIPYGLAIISGINITPALENIILKLPFILGDLLFAFLVFKFLKDRNRKLAGRAMLLVLFNPFFIWISSVWGMFDIWIVNFILLFLLSLQRKNFLMAGFFLALAPEIKLFPVFFLPAIFIYVLQTVKQNVHRMEFFLFFIVTTLAIVVPFFLSNPQGFMNQNLIMHLHRGPQGIGIIAISDFFSHIYNFDVSFLVTIGSVLVLFIVLAFNLLALAYMKGKVERLLMIILLIYTSVLVFNKVVNEQYFVVFVALLIILTHFPKREVVMFSRKFLARVEWTATFSVLFAGVVLGFHFLTFLPPFISEGYFKTSTNYLVFYLSRLIPDLPLYAYPNSMWTYYHLPVVITYIVLIPLILLCSYIVLKGLAQVFLLRKDIYAEIISYLKAFLTIKNATIIMFLFTIVIFLSVPFYNFLDKKNAFKFVDLIDEKDKTDFPADPKVGVFYYTWWNNSSLKKDLAGDAWDKTTLEPEVGYYTSKNSYFVRHIKQMKDAGIDFAIISYHLYDRERYLTFSKCAEELGLYYSPMPETGDVLDFERFHSTDLNGEKMLGFSLSNEAGERLADVILSSLVDNIESEALFRIDGVPVVFVFYSHRFIPSWEAESKKQLAVRILDMYERQSNDDTLISISNSWGVKVTSIEDIMKFYPSNIQEFNANNKISRDFKRAFLLEYEIFWDKIRNKVEGKVGNVFLLGTYPPLDPSAVLDTTTQKKVVIQFNDFSAIDVFDSEFFYSISSIWYSWRFFTDDSSVIKEKWEKQVALQSRRDRNNNWPLFLTVTPAYNEKLVRPFNPFEPIPPKINGINTYDWAWETALKNKPDFILITSWNEFFEGTAIEPSKEYGNYYLEETKKWIKEFKK